jgi:hypothetical protein
MRFAATVIAIVAMIGVALASPVCVAVFHRGVGCS